MGIVIQYDFVAKLDVDATLIVQQYSCIKWQNVDVNSNAIQQLEKYGFTCVRYGGQAPLSFQAAINKAKKNVMQNSDYEINLEVSKGYRREGTCGANSEETSKINKII